MKSYNTIYYLLFVLLILGAFASMAQNSYGLTILGSVAIAFGLVFLIRFIQSFDKDRSKDIFIQAELLCLSVLSFIFALRMFHIYLPYIEILFAGAGLLLAILYGRKMVQGYRMLQPKNSKLAIIILIYYLSILLFIVSLVAAPFLPQFSPYIGILAFILLLGFLIAAFLNREFLIEGSNISVFKQITHFRDRSVILVSLFFFMSLYIGLTRAGILPSMYSDDFPQAYFKLVNKAESGKELPVNGKYRHQEFKERYDDFLKRNIKKNP
jgi:hypothetical protein